MINYIIISLLIVIFATLIVIQAMFVSDKKERETKYLQTLNWMNDAEYRLKKAIDEVQKTVDAYEDLIKKLDDEINNSIAQ